MVCPGKTFCNSRASFSCCSVTRLCSSSISPIFFCAMRHSLLTLFGNPESAPGLRQATPRLVADHLVTIATQQVPDQRIDLPVCKEELLPLFPLKRDS